MTISENNSANSIYLQDFSKDSTQKNRRFIIAVIFIAVILLVILILSIIFLLSPTTKAGTVARLRDILIIFMAFESLLIGLTLVILMIQLSKLINLLNNEVKPMLNSTNETINTLRGTTAFLSDNLVKPVIKTNEYFAGIQEVFRIFGFKHKKRK